MKRNISIQKLLGAALFALFMSSAVLALDLSEAKSSGQVGESIDGYLAAVESSADVDDLVVSINSQRKAHYQKIADKNGISLEAVEARAGKKAIEKTSPGAYIDIGEGWQKK